MLFAIVGLLIAVLILGFGLTKTRHLLAGRGSAWLLTVSAVVASERIVQSEPAGFRMVAIILALLYSLKSLVTIESRNLGEKPLSFAVWMGFATCWFGMRPRVFSDIPEIDGRSRGKLALALVKNGLIRLLLGAAFLIAARLVWIGGAMSEGPNFCRRWLATGLLLSGLSLCVHFGLFNILAGVWNGLGASCKPLFRAPLLSKSLTEFWGKRWNFAFSEMTALVVFRPLRPVLGIQAATTIAFLFSGLLHELAISLPVKQGFGLPSIYFWAPRVRDVVGREMEKLMVLPPRRRVSSVGMPVDNRPATAFVPPAIHQGMRLAVD